MLFFLLFLAVTVSLDARNTWYDKYREFYEEIVPRNETLLKLFKQHLQDYENMTRKQKRADFAVPLFSCPSLSSTEPTSVHMLGPGDIDVVAALGDSLTAGQGLRAEFILDFTEFRGESFSIGGKGNYYSHLTLPNIIKLYNPNVYGYSTGPGSYTSEAAKLNIANPGDEAVNMPYQARELVRRINNDNNIDAANAWKLVTLFIGGNDLCGFCTDREFYNEINYIKHIEDALDILHNGLTRTFVNLVMIFDIAPIANMKVGFLCGFAHGYACNCGKDSSLKEELLDLTKKYQSETEMLVSSGKYDTRDDFTVVVQPFFRNTVPPPNPNVPSEVDMTYFAPDCFHFSEKGHMAAALSLWNNMIEGVCEKKTEWQLDAALLCPGQFVGMRKEVFPMMESKYTSGRFSKPYFATYKNSQDYPYAMCE